MRRNYIRSLVCLKKLELTEKAVEEESNFDDGEVVVKRENILSCYSKIIIVISEKKWHERN